MRVAETLASIIANEQRLPLNLRYMGAAILCALAVGGFAAETAAADNTSTVSNEHVLNVPSRIQIGQLGRALPAVCGDPGANAPIAKQENAMRCLINHQQPEPLIDDPALDLATSLKIDDIFNCNDFSHYACGNRARAHDPAEYPLIGEILLEGDPYCGTAVKGYEGFMDSPTHEPYINYPYWDAMGVALKRVGGLSVWAIHFATYSRPSVGVNAPEGGVEVGNCLG
jgi:hypothetical protein